MEEERATCSMESQCCHVGIEEENGLESDLHGTICD